MEEKKRRRKKFIPEEMEEKNRGKKICTYSPPASNKLISSSLTLQRIVDSMVLPGVIEQQHVEEEVQVRPQLVGVGVSDLPQELGEDGGGEERVLPAAELEQLHGVL